MATFDIKDTKGKKVGTADVADAVFAIEPNTHVVHQVVRSQMAARRSGTHDTRTRGEVRGGGAKPWRQKGTGRARQGSIRSPQWVGGGVSHGPQPRSHAVRVNKKMKQGALRSALTDALQSGKLAVVKDLTFEEPKTREAAAVLEALGLKGKVLLVLDEPREVVEKSFRNLPTVRVAYAKGLGTYEVLAADRVLFTGAALAVLQGEKQEAAG